MKWQGWRKSTKTSYQWVMTPLNWSHWCSNLTRWGLQVDTIRSTAGNYSASLQVLATLRFGCNQH
jgi:hypothetical protein